MTHSFLGVDNIWVKIRVRVKVTIRIRARTRIRTITSVTPSFHYGRLEMLNMSECKGFLVLTIYFVGVHSNRESLCDSTCVVH